MIGMENSMWLAMGFEIEIPNGFPQITFTIYKAPQTLSLFNHLLEMTPGPGSFGHIYIVLYFHITSCCPNFLSSSRTSFHSLMQRIILFPFFLALVYAHLLFPTCSPLIPPSTLTETILNELKVYYFIASKFE